MAGRLAAQSVLFLGALLAGFSELLSRRRSGGQTGGDETARISSNMIFPPEYKSVGVIRTDKTLSEAHDELLRRQTTNNEIYFLSKYLIVFASGGYAIYTVTSKGDGLFRKVSSLTRIASDEEIMQYDKPINIHNRTMLIKTAHECRTDKVNTVIFKSVDHHLTFVHDPDPKGIIEIDVLDVIPPEPGWLVYMIRQLSDSLLGELGVTFTHNILDLRHFESEDAVFPCFISGLRGRYLDSDEITEPATLIGCDISKSIIDQRFPDIKYKFINICPLTSHAYTITKPFIARCCQSDRSGLANIGGIDGVIVHWGASGFEIADALRNLVDKMRQ